MHGEWRITILPNARLRAERLTVAGYEKKEQSYHYHSFSSQYRCALGKGELLLIPLRNVPL